MTDDSDDLFGGKKDRDKGMKKVGQGSPDYLIAGMDLIARLPNGSEWSGEAIRLKCLRAGLRYHHPNVHGTLIKNAVDRGLLRHTGRYVHMRVRHNHARSTPVYRIRSNLDPLPLLPDVPPSPPRPKLIPTQPSNATLDSNGRLIHRNCAICGQDAAFGAEVVIKDGMLGVWYCRQHWNDRNTGRAHV